MSITLSNVNSILHTNSVQTPPVGSIICYAGSSSPSGWLLCDGSSINKNDYAQLFGIIGNTYGSGTSTTFVLPNLCQKMPIGKSNSNSLGETGGNNSVSLTSNNLPSHAHTGTTIADGVHSHMAFSNTAGSHTHTVNDSGHTHSITSMNDDFNNSGGGVPVQPSFANDSAGSMTWNNMINSATTGITIGSVAGHSHTISVNNSSSHTHTFTTDTTGSGTAVDITNPYIVLNYIIKY